MRTREEVDQIVLNSIQKQAEIYHQPKLNDKLQNDIGFDSLDYTEMLFILEEELGRSLPLLERKLVSVKTVQDVLDIVHIDMGFEAPRPEAKSKWFLFKSIFNGKEKENG